MNPFSSSNSCPYKNKSKRAVQLLKACHRLLEIQAMQQPVSSQEASCQQSAMRIKRDHPLVLYGVLRLKYRRSLKKISEMMILVMTLKRIRRKKKMMEISMLTNFLTLQTIRIKESSRTQQFPAQSSKWALRLQYKLVMKRMKMKTGGVMLGAIMRTKWLTTLTIKTPILIN